jgi:RNA polymerase sigma-70 factor (ECF subfamily)
MAHSSDHEMLERYRRGEVGALGDLVEQYRRPLFAFILKMTEGREDADEIFQEVWLRVIRHQHRYRAKSFKSWLFRIAHNLVIDRARKRRPQVDLQGTAPAEAGDVFENRVADPAPAPGERLADRELGRRIREAVSALPPAQREVFLMRTEADLPFKEIARIQGTSINTALGRMHYAVGRLRGLLQEEYAEFRGAVG